MKKIKSIFIFLLIGVVVCCAYIAFAIAPKGLRIQHYNFSNTQIVEELNGFKIGYFSDLDIKNKKDIQRLEKVVDKINEANFNLILFGGDIYDSEFIEKETITSLLKKIDATHGKFAVLGEKDYTNPSDATSILELGGFEVLSNESRPIYYNNSAILLLGLESTGDLSTLITESTTGYYKVALVHQPDYFTKSLEYQIDLQVSGHSHGGYIYLPFLGAINPIEGAKTYNHGHYEENSSNLVVSNGIGMEENAIARLFCTPDIISITLNQK